MNRTDHENARRRTRPEGASRSTTFVPRDTIVAQAAAQGMAKDRRYEVVDLDENQTAFGNFVTYQIREAGGAPFWVANLHLLARLADAGG